MVTHTIPLSKGGPRCRCPRIVSVAGAARHARRSDGSPALRIKIVVRAAAKDLGAANGDPTRPKVTVWNLSHGTACGPCAQVLGLERLCCDVAARARQ